MSKKLLVLTIATLMALAFVAGCAPEEPAEDANGEEPVEVTVGEQFDYQIQGIDPGAGLMAASEEALEVYGLEDWELNEASDAAMTAALDSAYRDEEYIIVTGWTPHWKFGEYDLRYLEDPEGVFGGEEYITKFGRPGIEDDKPAAYEFLVRFEYDLDALHNVMAGARETDENAAAAEWVANNRDLVDEWVEGIDPVDGEDFSLAFVAWDCAIASTAVAQHVLEEELGYDVTTTQLDAGAMYTSVATGDSDAMVTAWLPVTHEAYVDEYGDELVDLGNLAEGARIGWVIPDYVDQDIQTIEDLLN